MARPRDGIRVLQLGSGQDRINARAGIVQLAADGTTPVRMKGSNGCENS